MKVPIADLAPQVVRGQGRRISGTMVTRLAESIKELGLQYPVGVYRGEDGAWKLCAGRHRVLACQELGWSDIEATDLASLTPHQRELWELDENLRRSELDTMEREQLMKRRAELINRLLITTEVPTQQPPPKLTRAEIKSRYRARQRGKEVPPTPRQQQKVGPTTSVESATKAAAIKLVAEKLGVKPASIQRSQFPLVNPNDPHALAVSYLYRALTKYVEGWPEIQRRVEAKLGKTIIERITELNEANNVVELFNKTA